MKTKDRRTFAVTSLGGGRWYWVVWPSLAQVQAGEAGDHLAEGIAPNKLEAIEQALAAAGDDVDWLDAGYARRYRAARRQGQATGSVAKQEFLYYDLRERLQGGQWGWHSVPHLIVKRTPKYVYIAATPYVASEQTGHWADVREETIRLERASLERGGYAFVSFGDADRYGLEEPLFYTTPYQLRVGEAVDQEECFTLLELTPPYTVEAVKRAYRRLAKERHPDRGGAADRFLALQNAYRQALERLGG